MDGKRPTIRNRGTPELPPSRFATITYEPDPDTPPEERPSPRTVFLRDTSRSVISRNDSPDVGFRTSVNPYRGCEHGCVYCYARPTHEYLGFSSGLDFETRILVKEDAPELLRKELLSPKWTPQVLALSGVTDPYQPIEARLRITRRIVETLAEFRNPVAIVTKNALVRRDIDLLAELAKHDAAAVYVSVTTLSVELWKNLEPRTTRPERRLETIAALAEAGIPVGAMLAPIIPGLTDQEIPALVDAVAKAGARKAHYILLRLPHAVSDLFADWLERHFPDRKEKVLSRLRSLRGGKLNESRFGARMKGEGIFAKQIEQLFAVSTRKAGLATRSIELSPKAFRRPGLRQLELFD